MIATAQATCHKLLHRRAATLVEVVTGGAAITVLLAAVLAPTFTGLRERQSQALCTARIGQLTKALLVYAQDYDDTPPFTGIGWEDILNDTKPSDNPSSTAGGPGDMPTKTRWEWAVSETWISQNPQLLWNGTLPEEDWPNHGAGLTTGTLFPYARFESLYRCPAFERIAGKSQSQFNYTRTFMGRKWLLGPGMSGSPDPEFWGSGSASAPGLTLKLAQIHRPDLLPMVYDEWWLRHVGSPYEEHIPVRSSNTSGGWYAVDPMHSQLGDEIGRYHGRPIRSRMLPAGNAADPGLVRQGSIACYDGHVELRRTPIAGLSDQRLMDIWALYAVVNHLNSLLYAQRGVLPSVPLY